MKIVDSEQLRLWDQYTIDKSYSGKSARLMEHAARECAILIDSNISFPEYSVFCGTGNNGGDGLCIAMELSNIEVSVTVYIVGDPEKGTDDFKLNLRRILNTEIEVKFLSESSNSIDLPIGNYIVDCIFGLGLNRPVEGWIGELIGRLNKRSGFIVSIDVPSGMMPDLIGVQQGAIIRAAMTITIEQPKIAMLFPENLQYTGKIEIAQVLEPEYSLGLQSQLEYYDYLNFMYTMKVRPLDVHKHKMGHARIIAGSKGMIGAAVLAANSCMRSGVGVVTASVPECGYVILQTSLPEVMCETDEHMNVLQSIEYDNKFDATAIGPGIGTAPETALMLRKFLKSATKPLIVDADALNIIAAKNLISQIPSGSILTPHPGEFDRLFGKHNNSFERFETLLKKSKEHELIILLKGPYTMVASPDGVVSFNSTGNPGMATAGSGDVLTGIICGLMAQGHEPAIAARMGVYLHGKAGDAVAEKTGIHSIIASDIISEIPEAWEKI